MSTLNNTPAEFRPYLPKLVNAIALDAGQRSKNNLVREKLYAAMSSNNWNNQFMETVVRMTCAVLKRTVHVMQSKGQQVTDDQLVNESAINGNALYLSFLVMTEQGIMNMAPPEVQQTARNNFELARAIMMEADNMFGIGGQNTLMGSLGNQSTLLNNNNPFMAIASQMSSGSVGGIGLASVQIPTTGGLSSLAAAFGAPDDDLKSPYVSVNQPAPAAPAAVQQPVAQAATIIQKPTAPTRSTVKMINAKNELDRPPVDFFGKKFDIGQQVIDLEVGVTELRSTKANLFTNPADIMHIGIASAVSSAFQTHYEQGCNKISCHHAMIARPFFVTTGLVNWLASIQSTCKSSLGLHSSLSQSVERTASNTEIIASGRSHFILNAISIIDNLMTAVLNNVLKCYSTDPVIHADSFMTDLKSAHDHIMRVASASLDIYEKALDTKTVQAIKFFDSEKRPLVAMTDTEGQKEFHEVVLGYPVSITAVDMTAVELGYDLVVSPSVSRVDPSVSPILFKIIQAVALAKAPSSSKCLGQTVFDYIATSDGALYEIDTALTPEGESMRFIRRIA